MITLEPDNDIGRHEVKEMARGGVGGTFIFEVLLHLKTRQNE